MHDRHSSGPFCRLEFVFRRHDGLLLYGNPVPERTGTQVQVITGNLGGYHDVRYMPQRFHSANAASA